MVSYGAGGRGEQRSQGGSQDGMLALMMRREGDEPQDSPFLPPPPPPRPRARHTEEFVDISQVQQLLLETGPGQAMGGQMMMMGGQGTMGQGGMGGQSSMMSGRSRQMPPQPYYVPCPQQNASVEDLVALWFSGTPAQGKN